MHTVSTLCMKYCALFWNWYDGLFVNLNQLMRLELMQCKKCKSNSFLFFELLLIVKVMLLVWSWLVELLKYFEILLEQDLSWDFKHVEIIKLVAVDSKGAKELPFRMVVKCENTMSNWFSNVFKFVSGYVYILSR